MTGAGDFLTDKERMQINTDLSEVRKSRIVGEVAELASVLGLDEALVQSARDRVGSMGPKEVKKLRKAMSKSVTFLSNLELGESPVVTSIEMPEFEEKEHPEHVKVAHIVGARLQMSDEAIDALSAHIDPDGDRLLPNDSESFIDPIVDFITKEFNGINSDKLGLSLNQQMLIRKLFGAWYKQVDDSEIRQEPMTLGFILSKESPRTQPIQVVLAFNAIKSIFTDKPNETVQEVSRPEFAGSLDEKIIVDRLGESWRSILGLSDDEQSIDTIVDAIVHRHPPVRHPNSIDRLRGVIAARLQGLAYSEIANRFGMNQSAASQSVGLAFRHVVKRAGSSTVGAKDDVETIQTAAEVLVDMEQPEPEVVDEIESIAPAADKKELTETEKDDILELALKTPSAVSLSEWESIARERFEHAGSSLLSVDEIEGLWERLHFGEDSEHAQDVTESQRYAIKKLQQRFVAVGKERLEKKPEQAVAMRVLLNTSKGFNDLDLVYGKLSSINPKITKNLAQRIAVDGAMELLRD